MSADNKNVTAPSEPEVKESTASTGVTQPTTSVPPEEDDLDDLDDLLDDFADDVLSKPPGAASGLGSTAGAGVGVGAGSGVENVGIPPSSGDDKVSPFNTDITSLLKDLQIEDPETKQQFEELVKQFETDKVKETEQIQAKGFDNVMKSTMERLKKSGETIDEQLKKDPTGANPEDMLSQLLGGLGGGAGDGDFDMSKLLVEILEQMSSKEVLYEPIKELSVNFPPYLEKNKSTLPKEEYDGYVAQHELTEKIVAIYESPEYNDDNKAMREEVNSLLESLQEMGQPPTELIGKMPPIPGFTDKAGGDQDPSLDFNDMDIPKDLEKELEEGCKQQ